MESFSGNDGRLFEESRACLAPMAGYTDAPFRLLCFEFGADFAVTEMVSADGLARGAFKTRRILRRLEGEGPVGIQLFGSDPGTMARAASIAAESSPAFIDLNFGCPVRKVVRRNGGAALMKDLDLMERISRAVVEEVDVPVIAKIRSGWSRDTESYMEAGRILQDSGISAVTLHPRYRSQGFSGCADWEHIARLRKALSIPVIANGDVDGAGAYERIAEATGCRLVMVGRGALGHPWIFREIKERLRSKESSGVGLQERLDLIMRHAGMEAAWKGARLGILEMRKHYRWYLRGLPGVKEYRIRLSRAGTLDGIAGILDDMREEIGRKWKRPA